MPRGPGMRTKVCSAATRAGRLEKATQFMTAADILDALVADDEDDLVDAYITLCVHAGIGASDVICCARLGEHAQGQDHNDAVMLLASVDKAMGRHLSALLAVKTKAGYSDVRASRADRKRAGRAAAALVDAARAID